MIFDPKKPAAREIAHCMAYAKCSGMEPETMGHTRLSSQHSATCDKLTEWIEGYAAAVVKAEPPKWPAIGDVISGYRIIGDPVPVTYNGGPVREMLVMVEAAEVKPG